MNQTKQFLKLIEKIWKSMKNWKKNGYLFAVAAAQK